MKTVYLVRHADAVSLRDSLPDTQRPLKKKGKKSAAAMAKKMKKTGLKADCWISSTAYRAMETAHICAKTLGHSLHKIHLKESFYSADLPEVLADDIKGLKNKHQSVLIFGHNPMLSDLVSYFIGGFEESLPKCGLAEIRFETDGWMDILPGTGRLVQYDYPGRDEKFYDRMRKDLRNHIQIELTTVLCRLDESAAANSKKMIKSISTTLAESFIKTIIEQRIQEEEKIRLENALIEQAPREVTPKETPQDILPPEAEKKPAKTSRQSAGKTPAAKPAAKKAGTGRKRGRPAAVIKAQAADKAASKPESKTKPTAASAKRGPGRPKKAPAAKKSEAAAKPPAAAKPAPAKPPAKKRPKKTAEDKKPGTPPAKRRPGRPRKSPAAQKPAAAAKPAAGRTGKDPAGSPGRPRKAAARKPGPQSGGSGT